MPGVIGVEGAPDYGDCEAPKGSAGSVSESSIPTLDCVSYWILDGTPVTTVNTLLQWAALAESQENT